MNARCVADPEALLSMRPYQKKLSVSSAGGPAEDQQRDFRSRTQRVEGPRVPRADTSTTKGMMRTSSTQKKLADAARAIANVAPRESAVLVVEDDPDLQWRLARMLTINGNRVVGTSSADGALALLAEWPVDLILIDEGLPGMTGLELAREVRARRPEISVVLMTGEESEATRRAARLAGAITCLAKPFRTEALVEVLRALPVM